MFYLLFFLMSLDTIYIGRANLKELVRNSPLYQIQLENLKGKKNEFLGAKGNRMPNLTLNFGYQYSTFVQKFTQRVIIGFDPISGNLIYRDIPVEFGRKNSYQVGLNLSYPLFTGGSLENLERAKFEEFKGEELNVYKTISSLEVIASELAVNILVMEKTLELLQKTMENLSEHYRFVEKRYKEGLTSDLELLQTEVHVLSFKPQIDILGVQINSLKSFLKNLLGIPEEKEIIPLYEFLEAETVNVDTSLIEELLVRRYDIQVLDRKIRALEFTKKALEGRDKPSVYLSGQYLLRQPLGFEGNWGTQGVFTVGVSIPIYDGFKSRSEVLALSSSVNSMKKIYDNTLRDAKVNVKRILEEIRVLRESVGVLEKAVEVSEKALRSAKKQYSLGMISNLELLNEERRDLETKVNLLRARGDLVKKTLELRKVLEIGG